MIIDYNNKEQMAEMGIGAGRNNVFALFKKKDNDGGGFADACGRVYWNVEGVDSYEGVTFRNFPTVTFEDISFKNCIFEDVQAVEFMGGKVEGCTFRNVSNTSGCCTDFYGCTFKDCHSDCNILDIDTRGEVSGCTFDTVTALDEDGYIIHSVYEKIGLVTDITNCRFINCQVGNEDGDLTYCSHFKPFSAKTDEVDNFDYESCKVEGNEKNGNSNSDPDDADRIGVLSGLFRKRG